MAQSNSLKLKFEPVRFLAFGSIAVGYTGVGSYLTQPARMVIIQNITDVVLMFSVNGIEDNFPLAPNAHMILDIATNKTQDQGFYMGTGDRLYVKQMVGAPTTGAVYFSTIYGI